MRRRGFGGLVLVGLAVGLPGWAAEKTAAERGLEVLRQRSFLPPAAPVRAYQDVWKRWGVAEKPAQYDQAVCDHYGLHPAPFPNNGLPLGLVIGQGLFGKGLDTSCFLCHASSLLGQPVLGLGNASLDLQALSDDLLAVSGLPFRTPVKTTTVRGTIEATAVVTFFMQFRDEELNLRAPVPQPYRDDLCQDIPAWWHLKRKKTRDHTGSIDARSVRVNMAFLLPPLNSGETIKKLEPVFADIVAYMNTVEAPKYPFPVDASLAARGQAVYTTHCAKCHGTYGPGGTYPNRVVPLAEIGTDPGLAESLRPEGVAAWNRTWFAREKLPDGSLAQIVDQGGYQAPPLDGVWATAPYFHNASVPTLYAVLNSRARPKVFTRSYRTGKEDYDTERVGWKVTVLERGPGDDVPALARRKVYDTTQPGRSNAGHTFGDKLGEDERRALVEYLKTL